MAQKKSKEWPFFTFLCALFFPPFRLSLGPTIYPWVSKSAFIYTLQFCTKDFYLLLVTLPASHIASTDYTNGFDECVGRLQRRLYGKVRLFEKSSVRRENLGMRLLSGSPIGWFHYLFVWNKIHFFLTHNCDIS